MSASADWHVLSIILAMAFVLSAVAIMFSNRLRPLGVLGVQGLLAGIVAYHGVSAISRPGRPCGCLEALGAPTHLTLLLSGSVVLLLVSALRVGKHATVMKSRVSALVLTVAVATGALYALALNESAAGSSIPPHVRYEPGYRAVLATRPAPMQVPPREADESSSVAPWEVLATGAAYEDQPFVALWGWDRPSPTSATANVRGDDAGNVFVSGTHSAVPERLICTTPGQPATVHSVRWGRGGNPRHGTISLSAAVGGRIVRGIVVDGLGNPIPGARLIVSTQRVKPAALDPSRLYGALARDMERAAFVTTDRAGLFEVRGWLARESYAWPTSAAWTVIDGRRVVSKQAQAEVLSDGLDIVLRLARTMAVAVKMEVDPGVPSDVARFARVRMVRQRDPPCETARLGYYHPSLSVDRGDRPHGVRILARALALDSRLEPNGWSAGEVKISAPGCETRAILVDWSLREPLAVYPIRLSPLKGARWAPLTMRLQPAAPAPLRGGQFALVLRREGDQRGQRYMATINANGEEARLVTQVSAGDYELRSDVLAKPLSVSLPSKVLPRVSLLPLSFLAVNVEAASGILATDYGIVIDGKGRTFQRLGDVSRVARYVRAPVHGVIDGRYVVGIYLGDETAREVGVTVGGPGLTTTGARVTVAPGKLRELTLPVSRLSASRSPASSSSGTSREPR